jgi:hypothetical protein
MDLMLAIFKYRNTPHATTGVSPAELLLRRKLHTHLDLLHPNLITQVVGRQRAQKRAHNGGREERLFGRGTMCMQRIFKQATDGVPERLWKC